jgi:hypothetical protein
MTTHFPPIYLAPLPLFTITAGDCLIHSEIKGERLALLWQEKRGARRFLNEHVAGRFKEIETTVLEIPTPRSLVAVMQIARNAGLAKAIVFSPLIDVGDVLTTEDLLVAYLAEIIEARVK